MATTVKVLADCLRRIRGPTTAEAVAALPQARQGAVPIEALPTEAATEASPDKWRRRRAGAATRTRLSLTVTDDGRAGMHAFRSRTVLPVTRLPLAVPAIAELGLTERSRWRKLYEPGMRIEAVAPSGGDPVVSIGGRALTGAGRVTGRRRVEEVVDASGLGTSMLQVPPAIKTTENG